MGYTHYVKQKRDFTREEWALLCASMDKAIAQSKTPIRYEYDETDDTNWPDILTDDQIHFNGIGKDGHETFLLERRLATEPPYAGGDPGFSFCKTAHKPYDVLVTCCLALAKHIAPDALDVGSDGGESEWEAGLKLAVDAINAATPWPANIRGRPVILVAWPVTDEP